MDEGWYCRFCKVYHKSDMKTCPIEDEIVLRIRSAFRSLGGKCTPPDNDTVHVIVNFTMDCVADLSG